MKLLLLFIFVGLNLIVYSQPNKTNGDVIFKKVDFDQKKLSILFFIEPTCPISKYYMETISKIEKEINPTKEQIIYIFPNKFVNRKKSKAFLKAYNLQSAWIYDKKHKITQYLRPSVTPEVYLVKKNQIVYRGAIDNTYYSLGKKRNNMISNYLGDALRNIRNEEPITNSYIEAIGCDIQY